MSPSDLRKRAAELRRDILTTLANTPDDYLMREEDLLAAVRLTQDPVVTQGELDRAQEWLEVEGLIYVDRDALLGSSWAITGKGRSKVAQF